MDAQRIDTLTATVDQLQSEVDALDRLQQALWCALLALGVLVVILSWRLTK